MLEMPKVHLTGSSAKARTVLSSQATTDMPECTTWWGKEELVLSQHLWHLQAEVGTYMARILGLQMPSLPTGLPTTYIYIHIYIHIYILRCGILKRCTCTLVSLISVITYMIGFRNVMSLQNQKAVLTCDSMHSHWLHSAAPLGNQAIIPMTQNSIWPHYPDTKLTSSHHILIIPITRLGSDKYQINK